MSPGLARHFRIPTFPGNKHLKLLARFQQADQKTWISDFVQRTTTQPRGNVALFFRDPDGNLLSIVQYAQQTQPGIQAPAR